MQIIDFHTSRYEEGAKAVDEYLAKTEGRRTNRHSIVCRDREDETHYLNLVFFDSYEEAMKNSAMPETNELAEKLASLSDGPASFLNLDIVRDEAG
jgi:hypothetical protein